MKKITFLALLAVSINLAIAQTPEQVKGGEYIFNEQGVQCLTSEQRATQIELFKASMQTLEQKNRLNSINKGSTGNFIWPIQQASGFDYNDVWGISNYVDHDPDTGELSDYNCGTRTYDTASGYDHAGIDIFNWPFTWKMVDNDQVEIVAVRGGQIINKLDGSFDRNCDFNSDTWNAVYLRHDDGSVGLYGHMKNGSLTSKAIGQTVSAGEYLGIVASSGNSTGPHLHLEIYEDDTFAQLIDPYAGACNNLNATTWWADQKPYLNTNVNAALTHSAPPVFPTCPGTEITNESTQFDVNDTVYFAIYMRDQLTGTTANLRIIKPDNTDLFNWNFDFTADYYASWWYWNATVAEEGEWKWEISYNGQTVTHSFNVGVLSIEDQTIESIKVFPNPTTDILQIQSGLPIVKASLHDILGKQVLELQSEIGIDQVSLGNYSKGVYFLKLETEEGKSKTIKVIKQ